MKCYFCGLPSRKYLEAKNRTLFYCSGCSLIFAEKKNQSILPKTDFINEYLEERDSFNDYFRKKIDLIEKYKEPYFLLDVGCGAGVFLSCAKKRGWKVLGIDLSEDAVKYTKAKGLNVNKVSLEDLKPKEKYDVITVFQTIEHIPDPIKFLEKARSLLKDSGVLFLTTPSRDDFLGKLMGKKWFGYYNLEHLFFFDKKSMEILLKKSGFTKISVVKEKGRMLGFPWILSRLFSYYYTNDFIKTLFYKSRPIWQRLDFIKIQDPSTNLVALAIKD